MTDEETVHYLTIGRGWPLNLCLGCGRWFDEVVDHDYAACHEAYIAAQTERKT